MRKSRFAGVLLTVILAVPNTSVGADSDLAWMDLMTRMWRAFGAMTGKSTLPHSSLYDFDSSDIFDHPPYPTDRRPGRSRWQPPFATTPPSWTNTPYSRASPTGRLDGVWETHSGAILVVRAGRARLHVDDNLSQDFDLRLDQQRILLRDRRYGSLRRYVYAVDNGRLVMQDDDGRLLLLRRLSASRIGG